MRVIMRVDAYPPHEGIAGEVEFANLLHCLEKWLKTEYPEWAPNTQIIVGYADTARDAVPLLRESWIAAS